MNSEITPKEKAAKYFSAIAAGAPISNCTWGKSEREIRDFYYLAARALEGEIERDKIAKEE